MQKKVTVCDGCGLREEEGVGFAHYWIPVEIRANYGEEGSVRQTLDFCDECFLEKLPHFWALGVSGGVVGYEDQCAYCGRSLAVCKHEDEHAIELAKQSTEETINAKGSV